ncbi:MAG: hypothetical protein LBG44_08200, partial [Gemmatimonadota bacterium]|nr:hypothetical protein [Gemmatimonadota bacterium]
IFRQEELVRLSETKEVLTVSPEIALDSDVIWVADPDETQVRKYSRQGDLIFAFGTRGRGPGEMESPVQVVPLGGDTLLVVDRGRIPQISLYDTAGDTARFIGYVDRPNEARNIAMIAKIADGRFAVAAGHESMRVPFGVDIGDITKIREGTSTRFVGTFTELKLPGGVPEELVQTYTALAQTIVGARDSLLFVASMTQDTIHVYNINTNTQRSFVLPTSKFRPLTALTINEDRTIQGANAWRESFSTIGNIFAISDSVIVVQFSDFRDRRATFSLVGVDYSGRRLFEINDSPRMLAWDEESHRSLGHRENDLLPSNLAWYSMRDVNGAGR